MSQFWKIGGKDDHLNDPLWFYVYAPSQQEAIKTLEALIGPQNHSRLDVSALPGCPLGYVHLGTAAEILTESEE
jgi:hypothetical protein